MTRGPNNESAAHRARQAIPGLVTEPVSIGDLAEMLGTTRSAIRSAACDLAAQGKVTTWVPLGKGARQGRPGRTERMVAPIGTAPPDGSITTIPASAVRNKTRKAKARGTPRLSKHAFMSRGARTHRAPPAVEAAKATPATPAPQERQAAAPEGTADLLRAARAVLEDERLPDGVARASARALLRVMLE